MEALTSVKTNLHYPLDKPCVYADLNGGWKEGNNYIVPLNSRGTINDLRQLGYTLRPGLVLDFWMDDGDDEGNLDPLLFQGQVEFNEEIQSWVAVTPWNDFHHASELKPQGELTENTDLELTAHSGRA